MTESTADGVESFDAIIIGAGQAGPALANRLTRAGYTVAVIERDRLGGTCVNSGCTPTKAMVASAAVARHVAEAAAFGVTVGRPAQIDLKAVKARAQGISESHRVALKALLSHMEGCRVIYGHARFVGPRIVKVGEAHLTAPNIFINVGGRPIVPQLPGLNSVKAMTNVDFLELEEIPRHLVIVGGSYIGLEFAQMFRRFGAEVTVVERSPRLLPGEDTRISDEIAQILEGEGVRLRLGAECVKFGPHPEGAAVMVDCKRGDPEIPATHVLLAVGRQPNTDDLGLEAAGIKTDARGYIVVDDQLRTSVSGVWALGDCNGRGSFTHTAYNDFEIVAANLLDGEDRSVARRIPVYALFIDPPLGRVGMTLEQAQAEGRKVLVGERPMTRVARAVEKGDARGVMRVVVDAESHAILGAAVLGVGGDEAVHAILSAMAGGLPSWGLAETMAIHPTVSELLPTVLGELQPV